MNRKNKFIMVIIIACILLSITIFAIINMFHIEYNKTSSDENIILSNWNPDRYNMTIIKEENQLYGKWLLKSTIYELKNEIINNTAGNEFDIEFFSNKTCKQLVNYENNSWKWEIWTFRKDHIVFGENPLPPSGDAFISIYCYLNENSTKLSLYDAHLIIVRNYIKIQISN